MVIGMSQSILMPSRVSVASRMGLKSGFKFMGSASLDARSFGVRPEPQ